MAGISIGRLRGGFCVYWWSDEGKRLLHSLKARSRAEAEVEAIDVYRSKDLPTDGHTVADLWGAYRDDLGANRPPKPWTTPTRLSLHISDITGQIKSHAN